VLAEVTRVRRRAITPVTLLLALEQVTRQRTNLCALLASGDVVFAPLAKPTR
jgi:hypothetical protein